MNSQTQLIKNHLEQGLSITPLEALNKVGCFRLGARIWDIKNQEYIYDWQDTIFVESYCFDASHTGLYEKPEQDFC